MQRQYLLLMLCIVLLIPIGSAENLSTALLGQSLDTPISTDALPMILPSVPDLRQTTDYSCGASALQAVLVYWGIDSQETALIDQLNSTPEMGTSPENITAVATSFGLKAKTVENMSITDLKQYLQKKVPVIIDAQAWNGEYDQNGNWIDMPPADWSTVWEDGHYMVVIGLDDKNVYLEDPSLIGTRGYIPIDEFVSRWHDYRGGTGPDDPIMNTSHLGIIITGSAPAEYPAYTRVT